VTSTMLSAVDSAGSTVVEESVEVSVEGTPAAIPGDVNSDGFVDIDDVRIVSSARNEPVLPGDPRDMNGDGVINVLDARLVVLQCDLPRCAKPIADPES